MSDLALYAHTREADGLHVLCCNRCGKSVSTLFVPIATDTPDRGLIVRAIIHCPECFAQMAGVIEEGEAPVEDAVAAEEPVE
jgi:hypothetical protein